MKYRSEFKFILEISKRSAWLHCRYQYLGKMRVIGLMGAPGSGKTTLAQAILLQMGYTISEMQATFTRIPMGE